jgi:uncharacterized protein (UPF0305 family)
MANTTTTEHSAKFEELNERYQKKYVTKATLKKWVQINDKKSSAGITPEEYKEITGEVYA